MRYYILTILLFLSMATIAQQKISESEYRTAAGYSIKSGDTLTIGAGSLPDGSFNYISEVSLWNGAVYFDKHMTGTRLVVVAIRGTDKIVIECRYLNNKKKRIAIEPDAAFIKQEIVLPSR
jgi:hypothetical protein